MSRSDGSIRPDHLEPSRTAIDGCQTFVKDNLRGAYLRLREWEDGVFPLPALDLVYRHQEERWYLEAGTTGILVLQGVRLEAGVRF
jgi:hypothetical protein